MYIPIMKNRREEILVSKDLNYTFGEIIFPLFEIIKDEYKPTYAIDNDTGGFLYERKPNSKRKTKIKLENTEKNIITLQKISEILKGKKGFIDFFRFSDNEYKNIDFNKVELSLKLSRQFDYYINRVSGITFFDNLIPVVSLKKGIYIDKNLIEKLIIDLQSKSNIIAIRITDDLIEDYISLLHRSLRESDYLMLDFRDQDIKSKEVELTYFSNLKSKFIKIVLNSPRKLKFKNGNYENDTYTSLIDNSLLELYKKLGFSGFGDFGGLKDELPKTGISNGTGSALALIYFRKNNQFYSIVNYDTKLGIYGYNQVREIIISRMHDFDPDNICPAMNKIKKMTNSAGGWSTWININLTRYIHQLYHYNF